MYSGNVSLLINSATNLTDRYGPLNTFVKVKVDGSDVFQTDISKHSFNPTWNEWTEWESENAKHISFQIHNDDRTKQIVAQQKLSLHEVLLKQVGKKSVKLKQSLDPEGELLVEISLIESERIKQRGKSTRVEKIYRVQGHYFKKVHFPVPTFCSLDQNLIWGLFRQGMKCQGCDMTVHEKCYKLVKDQCKSEAKVEVEDEKVKATLRLDIPHYFILKSYFTPTFCHHDGTLLTGFRNQGYRCMSCGINVHSDCRDKVTSPCGVDNHALSRLISQESLSQENLVIHMQKDDDKEKVWEENMLGGKQNQQIQTTRFDKYQDLHNKSTHGSKTGSSNRMESNNYENKVKEGVPDTSMIMPITIEENINEEDDLEVRTEEETPKDIELSSKTKRTKFENKVAGSAGVELNPPVVIINQVLSENEGRSQDDSFNELCTLKTHEVNEESLKVENVNEEEDREGIDNSDNKENDSSVTESKHSILRQQYTDNVIGEIVGEEDNNNIFARRKTVANIEVSSKPETPKPQPGSEPDSDNITRSSRVSDLINLFEQVNVEERSSGSHSLFWLKYRKNTI